MGQVEHLRFDNPDGSGDGRDAQQSIQGGVGDRAAADDIYVAECGWAVHWTMREQMITRATTWEQLLILAAKLGVGPAIVAGHHSYATGRWHIEGSLRGKITDADIDELERISVSRS